MSSGSACWILWLTPMDWLALSIGRSGSQPLEYSKIEYYGACTSIRVWYQDENEIEFGMVDHSWISLPLDSGTRKVLTEGYKIIIDKKHYCQNLPL